MKKFLTLIATLLMSTAAANAETKMAMGCEIKPIIGERTGNILYWNKVDPTCLFFFESLDDDDQVVKVEEEDGETPEDEDDTSEDEDDTV